MSRVRHPLAALLAVLLGVGFFLTGIGRVESLSGEAVVCEAVCRQLLANTTEGRQALVGSIWWAPLPFLLRLPLVALIPASPIPYASVAMSALMGVVALLMLVRILGRWQLGLWRWPVVACLAFHPEFIAGCTNGSSLTTVVVLVMLTLYGMVGWIRIRGARFIVYQGMGMALLLVTSMEMAAWLILVVLLSAVDLVILPASRARREAAFILVFLPLLYAAALWMLMNWLMMGDPLYFIRSLMHGRVTGFPADPLELVRPDHAVAAVLCALAVLLGGTHHQRSGMFLGLLGLSGLSLALFLSACGLSWSAEPALLVLIPVSLMAVAYTASLVEQLHGGWKCFCALAPMCLLGISLAFSDAGAPDGKYLSPAEARLQWLPRIERHVRARSPYARVLVCGYEGFMLVDGRQNVLFTHVMDPDFDRLQMDYFGHDLFVLIHRPEGRAATDSIHWKFPQAWDLGLPGMLFDGDWGEWRLFEVVHVPRRR